MSSARGDGPSELRPMDEPLFDSQNAAYAQAMFEQFARNPESVPAAWRRLFSENGSRMLAEGLYAPEGLETLGRPGPVRAEPTPVTATPVEAPAEPVPEPTVPTGPPAPTTLQEGPSTAAAADGLIRILPIVHRAAALVQAFRDHGHQLARIDPLGSEPPGHPQLSPAFFGTSMEELALMPSTLVIDDDEERSVADALRELHATYAGSIGYEFEHLDDPVKVEWLWDHVEDARHFADSAPDELVSVLGRLTEVEGLEQFLHRAYLGQKRFSIEGNDMLVPMLDLALDLAIRGGGTDAVIGMAHRGRLNVLTHVVGVPYGELLAEFEGPSLQGGQLDVGGTGDVKYHHGARGVRRFEDLGEIRVTLMPNPSHLEFVDPVINGFARARQFEGHERDASLNTASVVPILIHGDAAFGGEGVVAETLNMARLHGYDVGGSIHIIVNNQVGFTTNPKDGRSTYYASDLAKGYGIPVVHVNADDTPACLATIRLAMAYRARFADDFVIDLVGYRRHGHNEGDEPAYTQPLLYAKIAAHPTVRALLAEKLVDEGQVTEAQVADLQHAVMDVLREAQDRVREYQPVGDDAPDPDYEVPVVPETTGSSGGNSRAVPPTSARRRPWTGVMPSHSRSGPFCWRRSPFD
jgi:2-oxoglutarate dehydrogenase complex dehydrogenase (E1) component-like enzyme